MEVKASQPARSFMKASALAGSPVASTPKNTLSMALIAWGAMRRPGGTIMPRLNSQVTVTLAWEARTWLRLAPSSCPRRRAWSIKVVSRGRLRTRVPKPVKIRGDCREAASPIARMRSKPTRREPLRVWK